MSVKSYGRRPNLRHTEHSDTNYFFKTPDRMKMIFLSNFRAGFFASIRDTGIGYIVSSAVVVKYSWKNM